LAEPLVPEPADRELGLLDQQHPVLCLALRSGGSQFSRTQCLALRDDERMRAARSVGIESSRLIGNDGLTSRVRLRTRNRTVIHNAVISRLPAVAKCDAASASRYLRAGSRAVPA
jgi:hypothetical protein